MKVAFDAKEGLIVVGAEIVGPSGSVYTRLAFDTGATKTLINTGILAAIGYNIPVIQDH